MKSLSFMLIAGEPSGDLLAAELVGALKQTPQLQGLAFPPAFFGAGGPRLAEQGVELAFDLTPHSVTGFSDVLHKYRVFRPIFNRLLELAVEREPEVIICVDFQLFNKLFVRAIRNHVRVRRGSFNNWEPMLVQYVSPQVWASRPGRARQLERHVDLLLSIIPFEKEWYARFAPKLRVEFVGHPIVERHRNVNHGTRNAEPPPGTVPTVLLLPGSRVGELRRHLPVMIDAVKRIAAARPVRPRMVLPSDELAALAGPCRAQLHDLEIEVGELPETLQQADLALASTGTVTLECAWFGVPTVALYKASWSSYCLARLLVTVKYLAMPNLLAGEEIYPELIQHHATGENIARAALELLNNPERRKVVRMKLSRVIQSLGEPGASARAARALLRVVGEHSFPVRACLNR
jgi:lipid-A-disaccharide synthase